MRIAIGCDPNAAGLKRSLMEFIAELGHEPADYGSGDPIYANTAIKAAEDVASGKCDRGVLLCGTGIGMSIAANKVKGAYAACIGDIFQARRASLSNNANIITLGSQVTGEETAKCLVEEWLGLEFDPDSRSAPKVARIREYENSD